MKTPAEFEKNFFAEIGWAETELKSERKKATRLTLMSLLLGNTEVTTV